MCEIVKKNRVKNPWLVYLYTFKGSGGSGGRTVKRVKFNSNK